MPPRTSHAVVQAIDLIKSGMSAYAAAKTVGIAISTIYRSAMYREMHGLPDRKINKENKYGS